MPKKGKKQENKNIVNAAPTKQEAESSKEAKDKSKDEEMKKIMDAINNLDLDKQDFIDTQSFSQSKAILQNALDDLQHHLNLFEKGEFEKFPKVKTQQTVAEKPVAAE